MTKQNPLQIGQRVYSSLYGGRHGAICNITGDQKPDTVRQLSMANAGLIGVTGGNAYYDIVFDNGSMSKRLPESIIHGVQWRILDEIIEQDEIDKLISHHEDVTQQNEQQAHDKKIRQDNERDELRENYPYLKQVSKDDRSAKVGASNIRIELKHAFPSVKFSVRMRSGSAIDINWTDGPTVKQVENISGKYQFGNFNGMEDIYEHNSDNVFPDVFGGNNYIFSHRNYSDEYIQIALDNDYAEYEHNYISADISKPTVEAFRKGSLYNICDPKRHFSGNSVQTDIHCRLSEYSEIEVINPNNNDSVKDVMSDDTEFTVREGTKPGYVEILFNDKPDKDVRDVLKHSGFRWSRNNGLWYGKFEKLPNQFNLKK